MNFILRIVSSGAVTPITNKMIGQEYKIIRRRNNDTEFKELKKDFHSDVNHSLFGVLVLWDGTKVGLWQGKDYYIMTDNGSTFEKITDHTEVLER